jgi:peptidoglycan/LPS O-acetylase OafA/YrhL
VGRGNATPENLGRFVAGDPLRGIAALLVLVFHGTLLSFYPNTPFFTHRAAFGQVAGRFFETLPLMVYVFFALSGYLIARPFIRAYVRNQGLPQIPEYLRNRLLRIVPAFWVVAAIVYLRFGFRGSGIGSVAAVFGFAQTIHQSDAAKLMVQAWTLDAEMFFYLVLPVIAAALFFTFGRLRPGRPRLVLAAAAVTVIVGATLAARMSGATRVNETPQPWYMLYAFGPGVLLAAIETMWLPRLRGARWGAAAAWALLAASGALFVIYAAMPVNQVNQRLLVGIAAGAALVAAPLVLQWTRNTCWRVFDNPVFQWLGKISYSFYLVHVGMLYELGAVYRISNKPWVLLLVAEPLLLILSLAAAVVVYRYVEEPFMRLRTSWRRPEPAHEPAPVQGTA